MNFLLFLIVVALHYIFILYFFTGWLFPNKYTVISHISVVCVAFLLSFIVNGCIITRIERFFYNSSFTVIDPFLIMCNIKPTYQSRNAFSIISALSILIFSVIHLIYLLIFP